MHAPTDYRSLLAALPPREKPADGADGEVAFGDEAAPRIAKSTGEKPWQFSLRQLLGWLAGVSALFAILAAVGGAMAAVLVWILALVAIHVAANAWGTRTWQPGAVRDEAAPHYAPRRQTVIHPSHTGPRSRLSGEIRVGWTMLVFTALGAACGGSLGGYGLMAAYAHTSRYAAIGFGTTAATVLGAFVGFLASSFLDVGLRALWEATRHQPPATPRSPTKRDD